MLRPESGDLRFNNLFRSAFNFRAGFKPGFNYSFGFEFSLSASFKFALNFTGSPRSEQRRKEVLKRITELFSIPYGGFFCRFRLVNSCTGTGFFCKTPPRLNLVAIVRTISAVDLENASIRSETLASIGLNCASGSS